MLVSVDIGDLAVRHGQIEISGTCFGRRTQFSEMFQRERRLVTKIRRTTLFRRLVCMGRRHVNPGACEMWTGPTTPGPRHQQNRVPRRFLHKNDHFKSQMRGWCTLIIVILRFGRVSTPCAVETNCCSPISPPLNTSGVLKLRVSMRCRSWNADARCLCHRARPPELWSKTVAV